MVRDGRVDGRRAVRRWSAGPRRSPRCPARRFEAVLDMLAGRYPSDEFAELRPRLVWDRVAGTLTGRPGAQRLAVTSGGTIPDRGLFGVFLVGREGRRRVGELDEEMVYESRVGDVFTLGSTSWRIEDITHDRVLVTPGARAARAGCRSGRATRSAGRSSWAGRSARSSASSAALTPAEAPERGCWPPGSTPGPPTTCWPTSTSSAQATGHLPDDRTIVVERFRDELGDWRVAIHSPFGAQVHAPWALASAARLRERYGVDVQAMHADDGIVLRLPDIELDERRRRAGPAPRWRWSPPTRSSRSSPPRSAGRRCSPPGSASARPARCCSRAATPAGAPRCGSSGSASAQLLSVASDYGSFPIVLETMRECLQDVFDVPGPGRADARRRGAHGALRRGRDPAAVAVRPVAAVRLRRAVPLRGRLAAGRAPGRRAVAGLRRCWPSCSASRATASCASCSTPTPSPRWSATCSGCPTTAGPGTPRASPTCCGCSAR